MSYIAKYLLNWLKQFVLSTPSDQGRAHTHKEYVSPQIYSNTFWQRLINWNFGFTPYNGMPNAHQFQIYYRVCGVKSTLTIQAYIQMFVFRTISIWPKCWCVDAYDRYGMWKIHIEMGSWAVGRDTLNRRWLGKNNFNALEHKRLIMRSFSIRLNQPGPI